MFGSATRKLSYPAPDEDAGRAPEKKAKKKGQETRSGLRRKGTSYAISEDAKTHSSPADNDDQEEERNSPPEGGRKKRAASTNLEADASKKGKVSLADNSAWDNDSNSEWRPRDKPLAKS